MSESKDIIDLTLIENNITEALKEDDESYLIIIESEEENISSDGKMKMISGNLKGKFLDKAIASYKTKCRQFIE